MKRQYSLKGRTSFKEIYKKGKSLQEKGLRIIVLDNRNWTKPNGELDTTRGIRIGITIDRKVGKAFKRNRLKRKIKSICRELLSEMKHDNRLVIRPGIRVLDYSYSELKNNIRQLLKRSGVIE